MSCSSYKTLSMIGRKRNCNDLTELTTRGYEKRCQNGFMINIWGSSCENLSLGYQTKYDSSQPGHLQRLARILQAKILYYAASEYRYADQTAYAQAGLCLCYSHASKLLPFIPHSAATQNRQTILSLPYKQIKLT